jgi:hypothetical protein
VAQSIFGGGAPPQDNGLHGWVYAVVYGGFAVQALALATAFALYARARWTSLFELRVEALEVRRRTSSRVMADVGATVAVLYALANVMWAIGGERLGAPADFDTVAQRSLFVSTGVLALAAAWGIELLHRRVLPIRSPDVVMTPLIATWLGSAACSASGVAQYLLAASMPAPLTTVVLALGLLSGLTIGAAMVRAIGPFVTGHELRRGHAALVPGGLGKDARRPERHAQGRPSGQGCPDPCSPESP